MSHDQVEARPGSYGKMILAGLFLVVLAFVCLWFGSPARTGGMPVPIFAWTFSVLFAIGFILGAMGLIGADVGYPAFVSGLVLYFIVGALVAVFMYVTRNQIGMGTISDADTAGFWAHWIRIMAMWPYELITRAGVMGYNFGDQL